MMPRVQRILAQFQAHLATATSAAPPELPELQYDHFMLAADIEEFCSKLEAARPDLCRFTSLGLSAGGEQIPLLTLTAYGPDGKPPPRRPTYVVFGGIHAHEPASTHAALYTALNLIQQQPAILQNVCFHILPRLAVDAGDFCIKTSARLRSQPDGAELAARTANTVYPEDVNGDGKILTMRWPSDQGTHIADPEEPRLLMRRQPDSTPPFYSVCLEGMVHEHDATALPRAPRSAGLEGFGQFGDPGQQNETLYGGEYVDWNRAW